LFLNTNVKHTVLHIYINVLKFLRTENLRASPVSDSLDGESYTVCVSAYGELKAVSDGCSAFFSTLLASTPSARCKGDNNVILHNVMGYNPLTVKKLRVQTNKCLWCAINGCFDHEQIFNCLLCLRKHRIFKKYT